MAAGRGTSERELKAVPATPPRATYRLQFSSGFTFADATAIIPYLAALGVSHVYASPYLKARAGSTHGYDITDHNALNPEIGDDAAFDAFCAALAHHRLGQILDFVPNHVGIGQADNMWWLDVLEWGPESPYADFFDIDWKPIKAELKDKVLVPFLGDHYGRVLEAGAVKLALDAGAGTFSVWYFDHRFPVRPGEYARILSAARRRLHGAELPESIVVDFELIVAGFRDLRRRGSVRQRATRRAKAERLKGMLADLAGRAPAVLAAITDALAAINGRPGDPQSFKPMHQLLEAQNYRLAYWRCAAEEINYRRFFQINDLAGLRVEVPAVFDAVHRRVLAWIGEGRIDGLRIDHIDGLFDPGPYLQRLQAEVAKARAGGGGDAPAEPFYVVVEKILAPHERLRADWPIAGTTGYDFLNAVNGLFVDPTAERGMRAIHGRFVRDSLDFPAITYETRKLTMDQELASELRVLANEFNRLTETNWSTRDYTLLGLRQAMREIVACFPVYRTYVGRRGAGAEDRRDIDWAVAHGRRRSMRADKSVFDFIHGVLTTDLARGRRAAFNRNEVLRLARKFQQYTGPVMAKGIEDTAFYRYNILVSLNEVGGEPTRFGIYPSLFHRFNQARRSEWPHAMASVATHDTKRGADMRMRIAALSEMPGEWSRRVRRWAVLNRRHKSPVDDQPAPAAADEYLLYQTLIGGWPVEFHGDGELPPDAFADFRERICAYMTKAVREAKVHSSWLEINEPYEQALCAFVERALDAARPNPFLADFRDFQKRIATIGAVNSLAQTLLLLTCPGVPDLYQGGELWDLSLVDPDNRRSVDYGHRTAMLRSLVGEFGDGRAGEPARLLHDWRDGRVKMFVIWRLLDLRVRAPELFARGSYAPVNAAGRRSDNVVAFLREFDGQRLLVVAPRLVAALATDGAPWPLGERAWLDTHLEVAKLRAGAELYDVLSGRRSTVTVTDGDSGGRLAMREILRDFPVAVFDVQ